MKTKRGAARGVALALAVAAALFALVLWLWRAVGLVPVAQPDEPALVSTAPIDVRQTPRMPSSGATSPRPREATDAIEEDPIVDLTRRQLDVPVRGVTRRELRDTFAQRRGESRRHEALDILAPRHTPVVAVEDGTIAKLFLSKAGGLTVYQFDPTHRYAYYYAHLESYAPGLAEHDRVKRGQVLGYVGTSGNAPPDTPHLHFAVVKLTDAQRWWEGAPIDPFPVFRGPA